MEFKIQEIKHELRHVHLLNNKDEQLKEEEQTQVRLERKLRTLCNQLVEDSRKE